MFCWFYRLMISNAADGDTQPSAITQKHIHQCTPCRQFHKACLSLGERLKDEAAISKDSLFEGLSGRILTAIHGRPKETHKVRLKLWIPAAAACLALALLIGVLLLVAQRDDRNKVQPDHTQMAIAIQELRAVYEQVGQDIPKTWPAVIDEPLANELDKLTNNTESAVRFLVACVTVDIDNTKANPLN